jgi:hypothetical protein
MQASKKVLSYINLQHSLLLSSGNQTERLTVDLNRLDRTNPPYSASVLVKTSLKLIAVHDEIGLTIVDMLELSRHKVEQHQQNEAADRREDDDSLLEAYRSELVTLNAACRMLQILPSLVGRCNENLAGAYVKTLDDEQNSYRPAAQDYPLILKSLRNMTMSYAQDLLDQGATIEKYDQVSERDGIEDRTRKETLQMVLTFAKSQMEKALALADIAIGSMPSRQIFKEEGDSPVLKNRLSALSAYGIAAATIARFVTDMVNEAISAIGTVNIVSRYDGTRSESEIYDALVQLTSSTANARLN